MKARLASTILFAAAAATVVIATATRVPPDWKLAGVEAPAERPPLSPDAWFSGKFAAATEPWIARKFGFRGFAIRLAHQLDWELFGNLPSPGGTAIDVGRDHWLYEHTYIRHYVRRYGMPQEDADAFAARMADLRVRLAARGVALVVCLSPSKPAVYPEFLLERDRPPAKNMAKIPARDTLAAALERAEVPLVDCTTLLREWKEVGAPALFPRNGTHWNAFAAQCCLAEIWRLAAIDAPGLPRLPPLAGFKMAPPLQTDSDLSALYNMVRYPYAEDAQPYPHLLSSANGVDAAPSRHRAKVLGVGDSFSFQLADAMGRSDAVAEFRLLYYNKADYRFAWKEGERPRENDAARARLGAIDPATFNLDAAITDGGYNLVIVELNDVFARQCAWGFANPN